VPLSLVGLQRGHRDVQLRRVIFHRQAGVDPLGMLATID
jgi:hypothetical protein